MSTKACSRCGEVKTLEEFGRDRTTKDGRQHRCRPCASAYRREYAQTPAGRESQRRRDAKYRQTSAGRETRRLYQQSPAGRESNQRRAAKFAQTPAGREKNQRKRVKYRTRKSGNGVFAISAKDDRRLRSQPCQHAHLGPCNGPMHVDHIVPLSRGGRHSIGNLQMLCQRHNTSKSNRLEIEVSA